MVSVLIQYKKHYLPQEVQDWSGVGSSGEFKKQITIKESEEKEEIISCLAQANDAGFCFDKIADIIEQQF